MLRRNSIRLRPKASRDGGRPRLGSGAPPQVQPRRLPERELHRARRVRALHPQRPQERPNVHGRYPRSRPWEVGPQASKAHSLGAALASSTRPPTLTAHPGELIGEPAWGPLRGSTRGSTSCRHEPHRRVRRGRAPATPPPSALPAHGGRAGPLCAPCAAAEASISGYSARKFGRGQTWGGIFRPQAGSRAHPANRGARSLTTCAARPKNGWMGGLGGAAKALDNNNNNILNCFNNKA